MEEFFEGEDNELFEEKEHYRIISTILANIVMSFGTPCKKLKDSGLIFNRNCKLKNFSRRYCPECFGMALGMQISFQTKDRMGEDIN